jgi:hypothetical protein
MLTGALPQLKVMTPPSVTAALSLLNVQLAAVPVPTTVVGLDVSAGCPCEGTPALHEPSGLPALPVLPLSAVVVPPLSEVVVPPLSEVVAPPLSGFVVPPLSGVGAPPLSEVVAPPPSAVIVAPSEPGALASVVPELASPFWPPVCWSELEPHAATTRRLPTSHRDEHIQRA